MRSRCGRPSFQMPTSMCNDEPITLILYNVINTTIGLVDRLCRYFSCQVEKNIGNLAIEETGTRSTRMKNISSSSITWNLSGFNYRSAEYDALLCTRTFCISLISSPRLTHNIPATPALVVTFNAVGVNLPITFL